MTLAKKDIRFLDAKKAENYRLRMINVITSTSKNLPQRLPSIFPLLTIKKMKVNVLHQSNYGFPKLKLFHKLLVGNQHSVPIIFKPESEITDMCEKLP